MHLQVIELSDASEALERARPFLTARPAEHNLLLTIIGQSIEHRLGGAFWLVVDGTDVTGFALESPPGMGIVLAPMPVAACHLLAESITIAFPRVVGEAGAAAAFAGRLTEVRSTAVTEIEGQRLYELTELRVPTGVPGKLRLAEPADRSQLVEWAVAFVEEAEVHPEDTEAVVDFRMRRGQFWVWDHDGPVSMANVSDEAAGVVRVQHVYTPRDRRGSGYASACVAGMSRVMRERGLGCVLYTDLANPTSNSIYRAIGYTAVSEILGYSFA
jgi:ribosomal protein S18 acetylase RimI-like enzyme